MNLSEIYKKITETIGKITVNGKTISQEEFEKIIPKDKITDLSDIVEEHLGPDPFSIMAGVDKLDDDLWEDQRNMLTQESIRNIPVVVEIVAVPSFFDVDLCLSMRESAGMFNGKETNLEHVRFVAESVKASSHLILAKTPEITVQSAFFCLELFRELGLTLDTNFSEAHDSKFRGRSWKSYAEDFQYEQGHISQRAFLIVIVNLYKMAEEGLLKKVEKNVASLKESVLKLEENLRMLDKKK